MYGSPALNLLCNVDTYRLDGSAAKLDASTAAEAESESARMSQILHEASDGPGNFGRSLVGNGYRVASDGKTLISDDGLRQWRPPSFKPKLEKWQSNFEQRSVPKGRWESNGHLDITDAP